MHLDEANVVSFPATPRKGCGSCRCGMRLVGLPAMLHSERRAARETTETCWRRPEDARLTPIQRRACNIHASTWTMLHVPFHLCGELPAAKVDRRARAKRIIQGLLSWMDHPRHLLCFSRSPPLGSRRSVEPARAGWRLTRTVSERHWDWYAERFDTSFD